MELGAMVVMMLDFNSCFRLLSSSVIYAAY